MPNNSTTGPLTIDDLRNPSRKSGFDHVGSAAGGGKTDNHSCWRAQAGVGNTHGSSDAEKPPRWKGKTRRDPAVAAQDYCDYINGPFAPETPATLKSAGHEFEQDSSIDDPEYAAWGVIRDFKAQREGRQGYIYLITDSEYVKIGYSVNPKKRVAELQTGNARLLRLLATIEGTPQDERDLHIQFIEHNVLQEWFEIEDSILSHFDIIDEEVGAYAA